MRVGFHRADTQNGDYRDHEIDVNDESLYFGSPRLFSTIYKRTEESSAKDEHGPWGGGGAELRVLLCSPCASWNRERVRGDASLVDRFVLA